MSHLRAEIIRSLIKHPDKPITIKEIVESDHTSHRYPTDDVPNGAVRHSLAKGIDREDPGGNDPATIAGIPRSRTATPAGPDPDCNRHRDISGYSNADTRRTGLDGAITAMK